jgi:RNA polymerase sigma factor (sigma-70 family)
VAEPNGGYQTRPSLLMRLREPRDAEAWQTFVEVYGPLVYRHGRRRGLGHQDAEDVTQKVFSRIMDAIRSFTYQPALGRFRDWLGTLVRNEINRFLKQENRPDRLNKGVTSEGVLEGLTSPEAETEWSADFHTHLLQIALERSRPRFEEETWRAFEGVWLQQLPAARVAADIGKPLDWVYVAKSRVLKQLWHIVLELADDSALVLQIPVGKEH